MDECEFDDSQILAVLNEIQESLKKIHAKLNRIEETVESIQSGR